MFSDICYPLNNGKLICSCSIWSPTYTQSVQTDWLMLSTQNQEMKNNANSSPTIGEEQSPLLSTYALCTFHSEWLFWMCAGLSAASSNMAPGQDFSFNVTHSTLAHLFWVWCIWHRGSYFRLVWPSYQRWRRIVTMSIPELKNSIGVTSHSVLFCYNVKYCSQWQIGRCNGWFEACGF